MIRLAIIFLTLLVFLSTGISATAANFSAATTLTENGTSVTSYGYDLAGNVIRKTLPNGSASLCTFDSLGRRLAETAKTSGGGTISAFDYSQPQGIYPSGYDNVGNVLGIAETYGRADVNNRTVTNLYDRTYRLTTETIVETGGPTVAASYAYDKNNNRSSKAVTGGSNPGTWVFARGTTADGFNSNQVKSVTGSVGILPTVFQYDSNGNRTSKAINGVVVQTYAYDFENRLVSLAEITNTFTYSYDHRTRRVGRNESAAGGTADQISFAGGLSVQEYLGSATTPAVEYIRGSDYGGGIGGVLYTIRGTARSYNAYNSRGDVVSKTNDANTITWQAAYEAFGTRTQEQGTTQDRQKANTKDEDPTGLLNEGMRYRDLEFGIFLTRDPLGFVDGPNDYTYVRQNPWTFFDPYGLELMANYNPNKSTFMEDLKFIGVTIIRTPQLMAEKVMQKTERVPVVNKIAGPATDMNPFVAGSETVEKVLDQGVSTAVVTAIVIDQTLGRIPGMKGKGDDLAGMVTKKGDDLIETARDVQKKTEKATKSSQTARREAMRKEGIPTSQQPSSQSRNASGREQSYEVPKQGGGTQKKSVQQQTMDSSHPDQGHWEAGKVKTFPRTGETRMNSHGRPKLYNDKSKVDYDE